MSSAEPSEKGMNEMWNAYLTYEYLMLQTVE